MRLESLLDLYVGLPTEFPNQFTWLDLSAVFGVDGFRAHIEPENTVEAQPTGGQLRGTAKIYIHQAGISRLAPSSALPIKAVERHPIDGDAPYYGFVRAAFSRYVIIHCIEWKGN